MEDKVISKICAKIKRDFKRSLSENKTFSEEIIEIMADKNWDFAIFEEKTELSAKIYRDIHKQGYKPSMQTVISFCIGAVASLSRTEHLLKCAGLAFDLTDEVQHTYYQLIILNNGNLDITTCNKIIKSRGITTKIDDFLGSHSRDETIENI